MTSSLLINEHPLQVLPTLAKLIGLNEAIIVQQVHYWIANKKNTGLERDGYKWVYNSYKEWQTDNFPFWSIPTIQRAFTKAEKEHKVLVSCQPFLQKRDQTKAYRVDYDMLEHIKLIYSDDSKMESSSTSKRGAVKGTETIPENTRIDDSTKQNLEVVLKSVGLNYLRTKDFILWTKSIEVVDGVAVFTTFKPNGNQMNLFGKPVDNSAERLDALFGKTTRAQVADKLGAKALEFVQED